MILVSVTMKLDAVYIWPNRTSLCFIKKNVITKKLGGREQTESEQTESEQTEFLQYWVI